MDDRIKEVMSSVLDIPSAAISDDTAQDTVGSWDSLRHMNLVVALEEEFGIEFDDQDMKDLLNYQLVKNIVESKITSNSLNCDRLGSQQL